jgi:hypothetical protein
LAHDHPNALGQPHGLYDVVELALEVREERSVAVGTALGPLQL